jgi:antitoxin HicB
MTIDVRQYRVYVEPLADDLGSGFVSYAPELKGCMSDGQDPDEALRNIYDAISCWIADAQRVGEAVPLPMRERRYA